MQRAIIVIALILPPLYMAIGYWALSVLIYLGDFPGAPWLYAITGWINQSKLENHPLFWLGCSALMLLSAYTIVGRRLIPRTWLRGSFRYWTLVIPGFTLAATYASLIIIVPFDGLESYGWAHLLPLAAALVWVLAVTIGINYLLRPNLKLMVDLLKISEFWDLNVADDPGDYRVKDLVRLREQFNSHLESNRFSIRDTRDEADELFAAACDVGESIRDNLSEYESHLDRIRQSLERDSAPS